MRGIILEMTEDFMRTAEELELLPEVVHYLYLEASSSYVFHYYYILPRLFENFFADDTESMYQHSASAAWPTYRLLLEDIHNHMSRTPVFFKQLTAICVQNSLKVLLTTMKRPKMFVKGG